MDFCFIADPKDPTLVYKWYNVGVLDYDEESQLWLVQKLDDNGRVLDDKGSPIVNGGIRKSGKITESLKVICLIIIISKLNLQELKVICLLIIIWKFAGARIHVLGQYWIPRVRLMFRAEDPAVFAHRVAEAYRLRKHTEGLIR